MTSVSMASDTDVRRTIQNQYKRWSRAALTNDVESILTILAPNYTLHTYSGKVIDHKTYESSLRERKKQNKPASVYDTHIERMSIHGDNAIVVSNETSSNTSVDPITNKKLRLMHIHKYSDSWVKIRGEWRLQKTITQAESTKVVPL